jgi:hypothetical protein
MTVTVRRPVGEGIDHAGMRAPDPAIFFAAGPLAVIVEIFGPPNVLVEILCFVA